MDYREEVRGTLQNLLRLHSLVTWKDSVHCSSSDWALSSKLNDHAQIQKSFAEHQAEALITEVLALLDKVRKRKRQSARNTTI